MTDERAIEILDPEHREHYESIEPVNEACRIGMEAIRKVKELKAENAALYKAFEWALDRGDDVCGKCAYYIPPRPDEDYTDCGHYGECVKGIVEYFKKNG